MSKRQAESFQLKQDPDLVGLTDFVRVRIRHEGTFARHNLEQAFGLEQIHGIAARDPADAEPSSDLCLRDSLARTEFAVEDREPKRMGYLITSTRDRLI